MLVQMFLQIVNMSVTGSFVILFVLVARLLLKRVPKIFSYALWITVAFRLICPLSLESMLSLLPIQSNPIPQDIAYMVEPKIEIGIETINHTINASLPSGNPHASINPLQIWILFGRDIWLVGIAVLIIYSIISLVKLKKKLKKALHVRDNIYLAKDLGTPFVMGIIRPKIYLPTGLTDEEKEYILLHEQSHIHRLDHLVKILSFFVLCLHWFNPLVWVAFFVSGRDMEMSCDERVIKELGMDVKKNYSSSLLSLAMGRSIIGGTPLAFGEGKTKGRIKNVLNYKKPGFWGILVGVIFLALISIGLTTNPVNTINITAIEDFSVEALLERAQYGTLIADNKQMDFNEAKAEEITNYLKELKISKFEISKNRNLDRDHTNQIHFIVKGILEDSGKGNIYFNFSKDFSQVWVDNNIKPSRSYAVKKPGEVKAFFEMQFGSVTQAVEVGSEGHDVKENQILDEYSNKNEAEEVLGFWIKPDEPMEVIGQAAVARWLNSFKGDQVAEVERIADYRINHITIMAVDMAASDEEIYDYIVTMDYEITTATENYLAPADGISGKGTFDGLFRELHIRDIGKGNFNIVGVDIIVVSKRPEAGVKSLVGYMIIKDHTVYFDEVEIVGLKDEKRMLELGLNDTDMPNGYMIINENQEEITFELADKVIYTFTDVALDYIKEAEGDRVYMTTKKDEFIKHLGVLNDFPLSQQNIPFFIETKDGKVIRITEEFKYTI